MVSSEPYNQNLRSHCILVAATATDPSLDMPSSAVERVAKSFHRLGKTDPSWTNVEYVKNPEYLVLISESFMEARAAFSQPSITNFPSAF
ncbi:hypothetical protein L1887_34023 [Cichorium endivia]|nr:hypothetical protein L1887_34023 [Cichorium endivia]